MKIKRTPIEIEFSEEEKETLIRAKNLLAELVEEMNKRSCDIIIYDTYDADEQICKKELIDSVQKLDLIIEAQQMI